MNKTIPPIHPGEILLEEYLIPLDMSQNELARELRVNPQRVNKVIKGKASIKPEMAMRLGRFFRTSPEFWLNLQMHYDLQCAGDADSLKTIEQQIQPIDPKRVESAT